MIKHTKHAFHKLVTTLNMRYFFIGLAIVMFWRGCRWLMDNYFFPDYPIISHVLCVLIALVIFVSNNGELDELGKL